MSVPYLFSLNNADRQDLFEAAATETGLPAYVVEKDYYVTLVLKLLFEQLKPECSKQTATPFMFKGGTTLSKVFGCIDRMSEDIDLSLDMKLLGYPAPDFYESGSKLKARLKKLDTATKETVADILKPFLEKCFEEYDEDFTVEVLESGIDLEIHYPTLLRGGGYIQQRVLLECGGKAGLEPSATHTISPIALSRLGIADDDCLVDVLGSDRTFFEKITAIHEINHRGVDALQARQSRHIYDVVSIHRSNPEFIADTGLLAKVVEHKQKYFKRGSSKWNEAVPGSLFLVPQGAVAKSLEGDWEKMGDMFPGPLPWTFKEMLQELKEIDQALNAMSQ